MAGSDHDFSRDRGEGVEGRYSIGGVLTILTMAALAGALALPLVFILSLVIAFFSMTLAIYFLVFCLVVELMLVLSSSIGLRLSSVAPNGPSQFERVLQYESLKEEAPCALKEGS